MFQLPFASEMSLDQWSTCICGGSRCSTYLSPL